MSVSSSSTTIKTYLQVQDESDRNSAKDIWVLIYLSNNNHPCDTQKLEVSYTLFLKEARETDKRMVV